MLLREAEGCGRRVASTGAMILVVCAACLIGLLAVVFFPIAKGPFTASYGPATAFSSVKNLQRLELSIGMAALQTGAVQLLPVHLHPLVGFGCAMFLKPIRQSLNTLPLLC
jgi:hypothetical protein